MLPSVTVRVQTAEGFQKAARHAIMNLALIAGFRPVFVETGGDIVYSPGSEPPGPDTCLWLPGDTDIQRRLLLRQALSPELLVQHVCGADIQMLFPVTSAAHMPFDLPAAAFFFLSLHEQWTSDVRDGFGRFPASASLLGSRGLLHVPVVSQYGHLLREALRARGAPVFSGARFGAATTAVCMTHDIDYLSKFTPGLVFRELVKNFLFNRRSVALAERVQRLREYLSFGLRGPDPYLFSIDRMLDGERSAGMQATWLFKAGGNDKRDVTYDVAGPRARNIITRLQAEQHEIGLHPSFNAHTDEEMFAREYSKLRRVGGNSIVSVRQHYLRFDYPRTWRVQISNGCGVDSTLGFAEHEGFRNGCCHPFIPFDLERNEAMPLWELPLMVMDGTLAGYRGLDCDEGLQRIHVLLDALVAEQGAASVLFHNTAFDAHDFPGWGDVFDAVCNHIADRDDVSGLTMQQAIQAWQGQAGYQQVGEVCQVINSVPSHHS
jgi:hypothetical protein